MRSKIVIKDDKQKHQRQSDQNHELSCISSCHALRKKRGEDEEKEHDNKRDDNTKRKERIRHIPQDRSSKQKQGENEHQRDYIQPSESEDDSFHSSKSRTLILDRESFTHFRRRSKAYNITDIVDQ